jgi:hypothetical protein
MHGAKATTNVACKNDADILEGLLQTIPSHDFVFGRLTSLAEAMGCKATMSLLFASIMIDALIRDTAQVSRSRAWLQFCFIAFF